MSSLDEKQRNRFALLQKLYDLTGGVSERHSLDIRAVGHEIGLDPETALNTFQYLNDEGLAKWMAIGGFGMIAHFGVKEVEEARREWPTPHFPANIITITGSPGAQVVTGSANNVTNMVATGTSSAIGQLRHLLEAVESPLRTEAQALLTECAKGEPNRFLVAQLTDDLAQQGSAWKHALQEFAVNLAACGGGLLVEWIKFGLGIM
jgi:hypothetical protein